MWPTKKKPSQSHIGEFGELDGGGGYSGIIFFYKDANQTENFTEVRKWYILQRWKTLLTLKETKHSDLISHALMFMMENEWYHDFHFLH